MSGHSRTKLRRIVNHWLSRVPEENFDYAEVFCFIYDGTYFHKKGCLVSLMDAKNQKIIARIYTSREGYKNVYAWFLALKEKGLHPRYIAMDGEKSVIRAIRKVWPEVKIQRCLHHIQREGMRWLRSQPKTEAGQILRFLLGTVCRIGTLQEKRFFIEQYQRWLEKYLFFVQSLPKDIVAFKDLQRTIVLINNALPDMFYFLEDPEVPKTTNALEGFYSRLKADYWRHRGLTENNKIAYLNWHCFFKNQGLNSNTF